MIAFARRSCVRIVGWCCDMAVTCVRDGQTKSAWPRARAYKYPVIGSIQQNLKKCQNYICILSALNAHLAKNRDLPHSRYLTHVLNHIITELLVYLAHFYQSKYFLRQTALWLCLGVDHASLVLNKKIYWIWFIEFQTLGTQIFDFNLTTLEQPYLLLTCPEFDRMWRPRNTLDRRMKRMSVDGDRNKTEQTELCPMLLH